MKLTKKILFRREIPPSAERPTISGVVGRISDAAMFFAG
jgi:hypothetical protein